MKKIWYHGTTKVNAKKILKEGFKKGTYFADHLEDALYYGGNNVFEVRIDFKFNKGRRYKAFSWQVMCANNITTDHIIAYKTYKILINPLK